jgi:hypothetical protein
MAQINRNYLSAKPLSRGRNDFNALALLDDHMCRRNGETTRINQGTATPLLTIYQNHQGRRLQARKYTALNYRTAISRNRPLAVKLRSPCQQSASRKL